MHLAVAYPTRGGISVSSVLFPVSGGLTAATVSIGFRFARASCIRVGRLIKGTAEYNP